MDVQQKYRFEGDDQELLHLIGIAFEEVGRSLVFEKNLAKARWQTTKGLMDSDHIKKDRSSASTVIPTPSRDQKDDKVKDVRPDEYLEAMRKSQNNNE